ncbi:MAG TPA: hypothetical protein VLB87_05335, partial [Pyrinomonadaceae bacterium]|nr:hypothetical protein [Pyrinomonadaceae bacterium]
MTFPDWESFEEMLLLQMNVRLGELVARAGMATVIFQLLFNEMEPHGKLPETVKAACRHSSNQRLLDIATRLGWAPDLSDKPGEAAASVRTSLRTLKELMRDPNVKAPLQIFRVVFEGAESRIHMVGDYKDLHDRLHDIQRLCYSPILSARRDFPQGETPTQLTLDSRKLRTLINQLRAIVTRPTLDANDFIWIEESLETARVQLDAAIGESSSAKLEGAIALLTEVMELQPTIINRLLLVSVSELKLRDLRARLHEVAETLRALGADDQQLARFEKGVADVEVLETELKAQMSTHRGWQAVDNNLRLVESSVNKPFEDLEAAWRILQKKLDVVLGPATDDWAAELKDVALLMDGAMQAKKYSSISLFFNRLQTLASDRFYNVDKDMKQLCEKLRPLGH